MSRNEEQKSSKHIYAITIAKTIGTILVLFGHSEPAREVWPSSWTFMSTFRMPLFFFVSGLIISDKSHYPYQPFMQYWSKYCKPYIFPYLTISLIFAGIKLAIPENVLRPVRLETLALDILIYPWDNPAKYLWFIYALFVIRIITYYLRALPRFFLLTFAILLVVIPNFEISIFALRSIYTYLPYFLIGCIFAQKRTLIFERLKSPSLSIAIASSFFIIYAHPRFIGNGQIERFLLGATGMLSLISLSNLLATLIPQKIIHPISTHGLEIYLLQYLFIFPVSKALTAIGLPGPAVIPFSFFAGLVGPILFSNMILSRNRFLSIAFTGRVTNQQKPE